MALTKKEIEEYKKLYGSDPPDFMMGGNKKKSILNDKESEEYRQLYGTDPPSFDEPATTPTPQPKKQSKAFSKKDPEIIKNVAKEFIFGAIPGSKKGLEIATESRNPVESLKRTVEEIPIAAGKDLLNAGRGIAGTPFRLGLTAGDVVDKVTGKNMFPEQVDIPFLGTQQGGSATKQQLKQEGAGPIVSTAIPAIQTLFDFLLGKHIVSKGAGLLKSNKVPIKPPINPTVTETTPIGITPKTSVELAGNAKNSLSELMGLTDEPKPKSAPAFEPIKQPEIPIQEASNEFLKSPELLRQMLQGEQVSPKNLTRDLLSEFLTPEGQENIKGQYYDQFLPEAQGKSKSFNPKIETMQEKPQSMMDRILKGEEPKPKADVVMDEPAIAENSIVENPTGSKSIRDRIGSARNEFTKSRLNVLGFESDKVGAYGKPGKELVTRVKRAYARTMGTKQEFRNINKSIDLEALTPDEAINIRDVIEGRSQPINPKVQNITQKLTEMFDTWGAKTKVKKIENYFPRRLNEKGQTEFAKISTNDAIVQHIAKERNISPSDAIELIRGSVRKGAFEHERILSHIPDQWREDPIKEILSWQEEVSRRYGVIEELGKNVKTVEGKQIPEFAKKLMDEMVQQGKTTQEQGYIKNQASNYLDRIIGRTDNYSDPILMNVTKALKTGMVVSKLNPLTTVANELQGFINSYVDYGVKGLADSMKSGGDELIKQTGITGMKSKIFDEFSAGKFAENWMKGIGMEASEQRGFSRTARSTYGAINRAWEAVKKNPNDTEAIKLLKDHAMFVDDATLAKAIKTGTIPPEEMQIGIVTGVQNKMHFFSPGERPAWASNPVGSTAYMFHNYLLAQMKLLSKAPLHRQLAYLSVVAPVTGIPILVLRRTIQAFLSGNEVDLPKNPADWFIQGSASGSGTPADLAEVARNPQFLLSYILGGFSPLAEVASSRNLPKTAIRNFTPGGTMLQNWMFPKKQ